MSGGDQDLLLYRVRPVNKAYQMRPTERRRPEKFAYREGEGRIRVWFASAARQKRKPRLRLIHIKCARRFTGWVFRLRCAYIPGHG